MSNDLNVHISHIVNQLGIRCILINPDRFIRDYSWVGSDLGDLLSELEWAGLLDIHDIRKKDIRDYSVLYYSDSYLESGPPSIYVRGDPICYGPCIMFNKGIESLSEEDVNYLCNRKYLYTYDGKTGLCIRLE